MKINNGFSLLEIIITLSIIITLMAISVPAFQHFFDDEDDKRVQAQLLHHIQLAHHEARALNVTMVLCKSNNHATCSGAWSQGQILFINPNKDGVVHEKKQIIAILQMPITRGILHWRSFPYYRDYLLFAVAQNDNGTFWYCHAAKQSPAWAMTLNKIGGTHLIYPDKNGEIKDSKGKLLTCLEDN